MESKTFTCPRCNATLTNEKELDVFFCDYCGNRIDVGENSRHRYEARTRIEEMHHKERIADKEFEQERYRNKHEDERNLKEWFHLFSHRFAPYIGVAIILLSLTIFGSCTDAEQRKEIKLNNDIVAERTARLNGIENDIKEAIQNNDYDLALILVNQLRYDDDYDYNYANVYEDKREVYTQLINDMKRQNMVNDPEYVLIPASSDTFKGKHSEEIEDLLTSIGFTSITLQPSVIKADKHNPDGTIEHIVVGGKSTFSSEDYFHKDTAIVIHYYTN